MPPKDKPPSIKETSFECPFCGVLTSQKWLNVFGQPCTENDNIPHLPTDNYIKSPPHLPNSQEYFDWRKQWAVQIGTGQPFINRSDVHVDHLEEVNNIFLSQCFDCSQISIWIHDSLVFPSNRHGPPPNPDLPDHIKNDYEEASSILQLSPRGAAALLRLCVQKLCIHLGEKGGNLNDDIGNLVQKGLDPLIQKALDAMRVIGNAAVHPGHLDLNDDPEIASQLFVLLNLITERMIGHPKHIEDMYGKISGPKKDAIGKRDNPTT